MKRWVAVLAGLLLVAGCSQARYRERYQRSPATQQSVEAGRRTFRATYPGGATFIVQITPESQAPAEGR